MHGNQTKIAKINLRVQQICNGNKKKIFSTKISQSIVTTPGNKTLSALDNRKTYLSL
jgi:hypothetical protein